MRNSWIHGLKLVAYAFIVFVQIIILCYFFCVANSPCLSRPFRFMEMWTHHDTFLDLVKEVWCENVYGSTSFVLCHKLKLLKAKLKKRNWEVLGNLNSKILLATQ